MKINTLFFSIVSAFTFIFIGFISCNKFKGDQEIPAYLCINSFELLPNEDYNREGATTQNITDAWVYIDGNYQGCYEMPATIPVLEKGIHKLTLYPGIKLNGISGTRTFNPFYKPFEIENYEFTEGKFDTVSPTTHYYTKDESPNMVFRIEDFDNNHGIFFNPTNDSDTSIIRTTIDDTLAWHSVHSNYSGVIHIGDSLNYCCVATDTLLGLPHNGGYTFLELDYRCDVEFEVGMYANISSTINRIDLVYVKPSDAWKKIYINLSPTLNENSSARYFKVFLAAAVADTLSADLYFDNIKIVYRD